MLKKISAHILAASLVLMLISARSPAQTRIRFAKGGLSTTVSENVPADSNKPFEVFAHTELTWRVTATSANGQAADSVSDPNDTQGAGRTTEWKGVSASTESSWMVFWQKFKTAVVKADKQTILSLSKKSLSDADFKQLFGTRSQQKCFATAKAVKDEQGNYSVFCGEQGYLFQKVGG